MPKKLHIAAALATLFFAGASIAAAQQDQGPIYTPSHKAQPNHTPDAMLSVSCDLPCTWQLDNVAQGSIRAGAAVNLHIKPGSHEISAHSLDGLDHVSDKFTAVDGKQSTEALELIPSRNAREAAAAKKAAADEQSRKDLENKSRQVQELIDRVQQSIALDKKAQSAQDLFDKGQYAASTPLAQETCAAGSVIGCRVLGLIYLDGPRAGRDNARARSLFDKACQANDMRACNALGDMDIFDLDIPHNYAMANLLTAKACNGGEMRGCVNQGRLYENGTGVKLDGPKALEMYKKACDGGNLTGCANAGRTLASAELVSLDLKAARPLLEKACNGGENFGCNWLGYLQVVSGEYAAAYFNFTKACNNNVLVGCVGAGYLLVFGKGAARDLVLARTLIQRACDGNLPYGCDALGESYAMDAQPDSNRALNLFRKTCGSGFIPGCFDLAMDYQNGDGTAQDEALARNQLQKACNSSDSYACDITKALYERKNVSVGDLADPSTVYATDCNGGDLLSCESLVNLPLPPAQSYLAAIGQPDTYKSAYVVFLASCGGSNPRACAAVGEFLDKSLGGSGYRDKNAVKFYFGKACGEGLQSACKRVKQVR